MTEKISGKKLLLQTEQDKQKGYSLFDLTIIGLASIILTLSILFWIQEYPDTGFESRLYLVPLWSNPHAYTVVLSGILFFLVLRRFKDVKQTLALMVLFDGLYELQGPINIYLIYKPLSFFFPVQHPPIDIYSMQYYIHLEAELAILVIGIAFFKIYEFEIKRLYLIPIVLLYLGAYNYAQFLSMFHGDYFLFHFENIFYPAWFSEFYYMLIFIGLFYLMIYPRNPNKPQRVRKIDEYNPYSD